MTIPDTLHAVVAEVALQQRQEPDGDGVTPEPAERHEALETSVRAAESLGLGFHLGAAMERIALAAGEGSEGGPRLREALWLIERYAALLEARSDTGGSSTADADPVVAEPVPVHTPEAPEPTRIVHELPSIRRELLVTAGRAVIYVAAVTVVVLLLTLIAQWY